MTDVTKEKISFAQLAVLLALSRIFTEGTEFAGNGYTMERFLVILVSFLITFALFLPLLLLSSKSENSAFGIIADGNKAAGWIFGIVICVILLAGVLSSVCRICFYTSATVFSEAPVFLLILLPLPVCAYAAAKGVQGLARGGTLIAGLFITFLVFIAISLWGRFDAGWLYVPDKISGNFWYEVIKHVGRSSELLIFGVLSCFAGKGAKKAVFCYLPAALLLSELMLLAETLVLGPFLNSAAFPFFTISAMSDIVLFQRLDGIDAMAWTLMFIVKAGISLLCIKTVFGQLAGKKAGLWALWISAGITAAFALFLGGSIGLSVMTDRFLVLVIPAAGLLTALAAGILLKRSGQKEERASEKTA